MLTRTAMILALSIGAGFLGACETSGPQQAGKWSYPGEQPAPVQPKPLLHLATLPENPAAVPYASITDEPTRFTFRPRPVFVDEVTGQVDDSFFAADVGDVGQ